MRKLRIAVIIFFLLSAGVFAGYRIESRLHTDQVPPVLTSDTDSISISVEAEESALFQGLHAEDNADGDITDEIRVASMSNFTERGKRTVNYAVFDSSGHAATLSRELVYTDYTSPRITLNEPLRFSLSEAESWDTSEFLELFQAQDCLDGDLSNAVQVNVEENGYVSGAGDYTVNVQVSNSAGDVTAVPVRMTVTDPSDEGESEKYYPVLSQYIVYTSLGQGLDLYSLLTGLQHGSAQFIFGSEELSGEITPASVAITDRTDYNTPGAYLVDYSYTTAEGVTAVTTLTVVVEE